MGGKQAHHLHARRYAARSAAACLVRGVKKAEAKLNNQLLHLLPTCCGSSTTRARGQNLEACMVTWPHSSSRIIPAPWWLSTTHRAFTSAAGGGDWRPELSGSWRLNLIHMATDGHIAWPRQTLGKLPAVTITPGCQLPLREGTCRQQHGAPARSQICAPAPLSPSGSAMLSSGTAGGGGGNRCT